jgi:hypothetical protein
MQMTCMRNQTAAAAQQMSLQATAAAAANWLPERVVHEAHGGVCC